MILIYQFRSFDWLSPLDGQQANEVWSINITDIVSVCLSKYYFQNRKFHLLFHSIPEKAKFDEVVKQDGVQVFIDRKAQLTLLGTEMDFVESKLSAEFVFNNPNIKGTCGCGESFNI